MAPARSPPAGALDARPFRPRRDPHLLGLILAGDAAGALAAVRDQYDLGVEPSALIRGLLEAVHGITRAKIGGAHDPAQSVEEREAYADWASRLCYAAIHRLWQLLLRGLAEIHGAPTPLEAAEMALLRVIHASDLPDPGAMIEKLASGEGVPATAPSAAPKSEDQGALLRMPASFAELVELLATGNKPHIAQQLHDFVGLVRYEPPELVVSPLKPLPATSSGVSTPRSSLRPALGGARGGQLAGRALAARAAKRKTERLE